MTILITIDIINLVLNRVYFLIGVPLFPFEEAVLREVAGIVLDPIVLKLLWQEAVVKAGCFCSSPLS